MNFNPQSLVQGNLLLTLRRRCHCCTGMSASASPTATQKPDPPDPMTPPEAGGTEGDQLFGTPLAASDAGAEPPKFGLTEEQNTQEGAMTEGGVQRTDEDAEGEFASMEVDYGLRRSHGPRSQR